jgi:hypothetical protein
MPFEKMTQPTYPPRLWAIVGFPGSGKSTFAAHMRGPLLVIDADQRFAEVLAHTGGDVYQVSANPQDHVNPERIAAHLTENMPHTEIGTIVIDSLTAIITPLITEAVAANDAGRYKNRMAAFRPKALAMRTLQDAVTRWGTDTLWVYHWRQGQDAQAQAHTTPTISRTELARLTRSLNLQLEVVQDDGNQRRGIKVTWARQGRAGLTLWDHSGTWQGMPERIEAAVYDGLSPEQQQILAQQAPNVFPSSDKAIAWGLAQGAFKALAHARNAYDKLKADAQPQTAQEMRELWVADVQARLSS